MFEPVAAQHPGKSGFELVTSGQEAFEARYAFAQLAQKAIDAQYFLWDDDSSGRYLMQALLDAADRGVRVRLLLDDLHLSGADFNFATLNLHPNIEVRLFNPFLFRDDRFVDFLVDFARIDHRMHNKAFIVDNSVAIVGGRNIGNPYFSVDHYANFRDVDLFAAGPVVRQVSSEFDRFWNSPWAISIDKLVKDQPTPQQLRQMVASLRARNASDTSYPFRTKLTEPYLEHLVESVPPRLIWGKATLLYDEPDKPETSQPGVADALHEEVGDRLQHEVLMESAYFIPAGRGTERLCALARRGIRIRVLTNSLASTDEPPAYAGYMPFRKPLLQCGVQLYELRPDADFIKREWHWLRGRSEAELHTKAAVFDHSTVLIGSFNMDPRSRYLNTEMAILVESPALADKVERFIEGGMSPDNSYHLEIDGSGDLVWATRVDGGNVVFTGDPEVGFGPRVGTWLLSLLPIDGQL